VGLEPAKTPHEIDVSFTGFTTVGAGSVTTGVFTGFFTVGDIVVVLVVGCLVTVGEVLTVFAGKVEVGLVDTVVEIFVETLRVLEAVFGFGMVLLVEVWLFGF